MTNSHGQLMRSYIDILNENEMQNMKSKKPDAPFTDEEIEKIKNMYKQGSSQSDIATALGRQSSSIEAKLNQLFPNRKKQD